MENTQIGYGTVDATPYRESPNVERVLVEDTISAPENGLHAWVSKVNGTGFLALSNNENKVTIPSEVLETLKVDTGSKVEFSEPQYGHGSVIHVITQRWNKDETKLITVISYYRPDQVTFVRAD